MGKFEDERTKYFEWLIGFIDCEWYDPHDFSKALWALMTTKFVVSIDKDQNRVEDALDLRKEFIPWDMGFPVSILEIMVSMAKRIEDQIMQNTVEGNRTAIWFWDMMISLGMERQFDLVYNEDEVMKILHDFNNRKYEKDGTGSLFITRDRSKDMRKMELWFQMHARFNDILQDEGLLNRS